MAARPTAARPVTPGMPLLVLYGSQTGTAEDIAVGLCRCAAARGLVPRCMPMDAYDVCELPSEPLVVCIASTTGDGEAPMAMRRFWATLRRRDLPASALQAVRYAVFGCGDTSYPKFNAVARRLDMRLQQLGATQLVPCGLGDDQAPAGVDTALHTWIPALLKSLPLPGIGASFSLGDGIGDDSVLPPAFYGGGGAARLQVCFRGGASAALISSEKEVAAVHALASADAVVLFSQVTPPWSCRVHAWSTVALHPRADMRTLSDSITSTQLAFTTRLCKMRVRINTPVIPRTRDLAAAVHSHTQAHTQTHTHTHTRTCQPREPRLHTHTHTHTHTHIDT